MIDIIVLISALTIMCKIASMNNVSPLKWGIITYICMYVASFIIEWIGIKYIAYLSNFIGLIISYILFALTEDTRG